MLLWANSSYKIRSSGPNRCPKADAFVPYPLGEATAASVPRKRSKFFVQLLHNHMIASHEATRRGTGSQLIDRLLGGRDDARIPRHAQVIEACITDRFAAGDGHRLPGDTLLYAKKRILQAGRGSTRQTLLECRTLGKLCHIAMFGRDLLDRRRFKRCGYGG